MFGCIYAIFPVHVQVEAYSRCNQVLSDFFNNLIRSNVGNAPVPIEGHHLSEIEAIFRRCLGIVPSLAEVLPNVELRLVHQVVESGQPLGIYTEKILPFGRQLKYKQKGRNYLLSPPAYFGFSL